MSPVLPWQRRRIDQFADLLDGRLAPQDAPRALLAMGGLVGALSALPQPATPVGLTGATATMVGHAGGAAGAATAGTVATTAKVALLTTKASLPAWLPAVSGLVGVSAAITGVTVATTQARPGDLFYGLKQSVERAQVATTSSPADAARERLAQAGTRLGELKALVAALPAHPGPAQLATVHSVVADWSALVTRSVPALTRGVATARQLSAFLTDQAVAISRLPGLPAADLDTLTTTLRRASTAVSGVTGLLPSVTVPEVTVPTAPVPVLPAVPVAPVGPVAPVAPGSSAPATSAPRTPTPRTTPRTTPSAPRSPARSGPTAIPTLPGLPTTVPVLPIDPSAVPSLVTGPLGGLAPSP